MTQADLDRIVGYVPMVAESSAVTIVTALVAIVLATLLGIVVAGASMSPSRTIRTIDSVYVQVIRATPELVQVYAWFYFLPSLGIVLPPILAGIIALAFAFGPYLGEVFRAGILAVAPTQWEAGQVLGMSRLSLWRRVILPQAFRTVLPVWIGYFVTMYKATALLSFITVPELFGAARFLAALNFRYFELFVLVMLAYLAIGIPTVLLLHRLERHLDVTRRVPKLEEDLRGTAVI